MRAILLFCAVLAVLPLSGCIWGKKRPQKSQTHIYEGDAPGTRTFDKPESAGGALHTY